MPFLGIEIGGTKLQLVLGHESAKITDRRQLAVDPSKGAKGIRAQIERSLPLLLRNRKLHGVGVGFGGPVDWQTGRICRSHQIAGWSNFDLAGWLHKLTAAPVTIDNDANAAALGEALHGAGRGFDPVFYVTLGSGVGGGLVTHSRIYHGATPGEAEIGHIRLDRQGATVESRCSGWAIDAHIRKSIKKQPNSLLAKLCSRRCRSREAEASVTAPHLRAEDSVSRLAGSAATNPGGEARHLPTALKKRDPLANQILTDLAADLSFGLSHVVHLFHPQIIILGGGLSKIGSPLRAAITQKLSAFIMEAFQPGPKIELAELGEDAVPVGALAMNSISSALDIIV